RPRTASISRHARPKSRSSLGRRQARKWLKRIASSSAHISSGRVSATGRPTRLQRSAELLLAGAAQPLECFLQQRLASLRARASEPFIAAGFFLPELLGEPSLPHFLE